MINFFHRITTDTYTGHGMHSADEERRKKNGRETYSDGHVHTN